MLYDPSWKTHPALTEEQKILLLAADLLEQRGHCKNALEDQKGRLCVLGALEMAFGHLLDWDTDRTGLSRAWGRLHRQIADCPVAWNNMPKRTADEVISALRNAALNEV